MSRTTPIEVFAPSSEPYQDSSNVVTTKQNAELSKTVEIKIPKETFSYLFNPYDEANAFDATLVLNKLREFFNVKSNSKIFANDLESKISYNYPSTKVNPRKLNKLVKGDASLFTSMFQSPTNAIHPDATLERNSMVYEEISYDFKNMVEETSSEDPVTFWSEIIPGDNVMIVLRMDMAAHSAALPTLNVFIKFIVDNPSYTFQYNLDTTS